MRGSDLLGASRWCSRSGWKVPASLNPRRVSRPCQDRNKWPIGQTNEEGGMGSKHKTPGHAEQGTQLPALKSARSFIIPRTSMVETVNSAIVPLQPLANVPSSQMLRVIQSLAHLILVLCAEITNTAAAGWQCAWQSTEDWIQSFCEAAFGSGLL